MSSVLRCQDWNPEDLCRFCGQSYDDHMRHGHNRCPGRVMSDYEPIRDKAGNYYTTLTARPVCPHCGVTYSYDDADDLHGLTVLVLICGRWDNEEGSFPDQRGCGKPFRVSATCRRAWTTEPTQDE